MAGDFPSNPHPTSAPAGVSVPPDQWVDAYGDHLYAFALTRLRDPVRAEDMVQETFLAALKNHGQFAGKSSEKGWLTGILKNKILDHFRKAGRETTFTDLEFFNKEDGLFIGDGVFKGEWHQEHAPATWPENPGASLDNAAFWEAFYACADKLPKNVSRVFLLREMDDLPTEEICTLLNIRPNHLWVMLHRARLALRRCLETNWFKPEGGE